MAACAVGRVKDCALESPHALYICVCMCIYIYTHIYSHTETNMYMN